MNNFISTTQQYDTNFISPIQATTVNVDDHFSNGTYSTGIYRSGTWQPKIFRAGDDHTDGGLLKADMVVQDSYYFIMNDVCYCSVRMGWTSLGTIPVNATAGVQEAAFDLPFPCKQNYNASCEFRRHYNQVDGAFNFISSGSGSSQDLRNRQVSQGIIRESENASAILRQQMVLICTVDIYDDHFGAASNLAIVYDARTGSNTAQSLRETATDLTVQFSYIIDTSTL